MTNVIITGGARGIGAATARLAGSRGWGVGIGFRDNRAAAEECARQVVDAGGRAVLLPGDVSVEADVVRIFDTAEAELGSIDAAVIGAGILGKSSKLMDMDAERIRRTLDVNVHGAFLCAREAARRFARSMGGEGGSIVLLSSSASKVGSPNDFVDYASSKGAVDTLVLGLAKEMGEEGVRVNGVRPGLIDTEIHASSGSSDRVARIGPTVPLGRAGLPGEVAATILWLLGDEASYVSGALIDVTGGR